MPIYMDVHIAPGVTAREVAKAHTLDLMIQETHQCKCMTYWIDETRESVFCLIEAPSKESVVELHSAAHGMVPNKIIEVNTSVVESFLGRIYDPTNAEVTENGLKIFHDPSFRILMTTRVTDFVLLSNAIGKEKAVQLLQEHNNIVRRNIAQFGGREAEHEGNNFVATFCFAKNAVSCALNIRKEISLLEDAANINFVISINSGEPVEESDKFFGSTLEKADRMCNIAQNLQVVITSDVKELVWKDHVQSLNNNILALSPQDEALLDLLYNKLEENWQDPDFDMNEFCQATIMSKSQLYRKAVAFTGVSPNTLLRNFRLAKAKQLMKKQKYSISQITFDSGFTSPSYFTKCFKKQFGLLPMEYVEQLH